MYIPKAQLLLGSNNFLQVPWAADKMKPKARKKLYLLKQ